MKTILELQQLINQTIAEKQFTGSPAELYQPINYLMEIGGKRMRPALLLMAADLFGANLNKALAPALAIEVFHNFTLMHDDIMDNAPRRRNQPTVHEKWNSNIAILSGDAMLVEAYKLIMQVDEAILPQVLAEFNSMATGVCEGQQHDMNFENRNQVNVAEYIGMIRQKTAVLLGGALKIGALIGRSAPEDGDLLYDFGVNLGIAFQLQDDILDVYGDPEKFGKQPGGDIVSNKKTFLLIKAKELAGGLDKEDLNYWLAADHDPALKIEHISALYTRLGIRQLAEEEMNRFAGKALYSLKRVSADDVSKQPLAEFAESLLVREY